MKNLALLILTLVGISLGQITYSGGRTQLADTVRWGDADDSASYTMARGDSTFRDSAGTWVDMTSDSCSLPVRLSYGTVMPNSKLEISYQARTSSGNTDSSQVIWRFDGRYCKGVGATIACEDWVPAGRFRGDTSSIIMDSLYSVATASGTTWMPTRQIFDVPGGMQLRVCQDGYKAGGGTNDSTFFRRFVIRNSAIPAGGTPPSSTSITSTGGTSIVDDAAFTVGTTAATPAAGVYKSTLDSVNDGDAGALAMTPNRSLRVHLVDAAGDAQAVGGGTQYAEDAAHASGNTGNLILGVRRDTPASSTVTDGDNATLNTDANGRLWTSATIDAALPAGTNAIGKLAANSGVDIGDVTVDGTVTVTGGATAANQSTEIGHLATLAGAVAGTEVQADILTLPSVTVGTFPDNEPFNVAQINGVTPLMGNGTTGTGSPRVTIASDNTAFGVNLAQYTPASGRLPVDGSGVTQPVSYATTGSGTATGALRVELPTNGTGLVGANPGTAANWGIGATGAAVPANAKYTGAVSSGNLTGLIQADVSAKIDVSTATTTEIVALTSTQKIYVTSWDVIAAGTGTIKLVYGTGTACGTGTTDLTGAYSLVAQSGIAKGNGLGPILVVPASNALCVTTSAAVGMQGSVAYTKF